MVVQNFVNHLNNNSLKIVDANKKFTEFDGYHGRQFPMSLMVKSDRPNVCLFTTCEVTKTPRLLMINTFFAQLEYF